jgi:hypothetical protein
MSRETQDIATVGHIASEFAEYLAEGHDLCRQIAPLDLAGHPLYIVAQSQIGSEFGDAEGCNGYTSPSLDLYLQEYINDWQGRGPCMVVNDIAIDEDQDPDFHHRIVLNCILHELAHIVDRPEPVTHRSIDPQRIQFEALVVASSTKREESSQPMVGHGLSFVRKAIHLVERANRIGYDLGHPGVCRMSDFGLSSILNYVEFIKPEIEQCQYLWFRDFPPPSKQLLELFHSDTQSRGGSA